MIACVHASARVVVSSTWHDAHCPARVNVSAAGPLAARPSSPFTATWMAMASQSTAGKLLAMWMPISLLASLSFEHSIANFFLIPQARSPPVPEAPPKQPHTLSLEVALPPLPDDSCGAAFSLYLSPTRAQGMMHGANITVSQFITHNLIPSTLGNIFGGAVLVRPLLALRLLKRKRNLLFRRRVLLVVP